MEQKILSVELSKNLKYLRRVTQISQQAFSNKLQIPQKRYASYEEGRATPKLELIKKIANAYGIGFEEICFEDLTKKYY